MSHLKTIVLMRAIQLNKNFSNLSYLVLTTTQNNKKFDIFVTHPPPPPAEKQIESTMDILAFC